MKLEFQSSSVFQFGSCHRRRRSCCQSLAKGSGNVDNDERLTSATRRKQQQWQRRRPPQQHQRKQQRHPEKRRHLLKCLSPYDPPVVCWLLLTTLLLATCFSLTFASLVFASGSASERQAISSTSVPAIEVSGETRLAAPRKTSISTSTPTSKTATITSEPTKVVEPQQTATSQAVSGKSSSNISNSNNSNNQTGKTKHYPLPSWFNYELYKRLYGKRHSRPEANEVHKRIYLRRALRIFEQRAQYRAGRLGSLASVNELTDLTNEQLTAFQSRKSESANGVQASQLQLNQTKRPGSSAASANKFQLPDCCTYDQVYARIIELLDGASGIRSPEEGGASSVGRENKASGGEDWPLSRALVEELEQKPLVESDDANESEGPLSKTRPQHSLQRALAGSETFAATTTLPFGELAAVAGSRPHRRVPLVTERSTSTIYDSNTDSDTSNTSSASSIGRGRGQRTRPSGSGSGNSTTASPTSSPNSRAETPTTLTKGTTTNATKRSTQREAIEASILEQVSEQLDEEAPLGKQLNQKLSAYFGEPVRVRASVRGIRATLAQKP